MNNQASEAAAVFDEGAAVLAGLLQTLHQAHDQLRGIADRIRTGEEKLLRGHAHALLRSYADIVSDASRKLHEAARSMRHDRPRP